MLSEKQIKEIQTHLEESQNPLFFFDNDNDGLCGMLLLRRFVSRGKGVAIKSFPDLDENYLKKVDELNPDIVFILDKPFVSLGFIQGLKERNIRIVWIDHHDIRLEKVVLDGVYYYNSIDVPVTYMCYQIVQNKEDLWIAVIGCISDNYLPDFWEDFYEKNSELFKKVKSAFEGFYDTDLGKVARILNFGLKDATTNVVRMIKFLFDVNSPYEILNESKENQFLWKRFNYLNEKYQRIFDKARETVRDNLIFFQYSGQFSLSADIANELIYRYPGKIVVVVYVVGEKVNVSMRGKNVKDLTEKAIEGLIGATGGGHRDATGATLSKSDLMEFKKRIEEEVL